MGDPYPYVLFWGPFNTLRWSLSSELSGPNLELPGVMFSVWVVRATLNPKPLNPKP